MIVPNTSGFSVYQRALILAWWQLMLLVLIQVGLEDDLKAEGELLDREAIRQMMTALTDCMNDAARHCIEQTRKGYDAERRIQ